MVDSQELTNTDVNFAGKSETLDEVTDVCYAKTMTNKTIEEADQYVAIVGCTTADDSDDDDY